MPAVLAQEGYDFLCDGRKFSDDDAVVALGVGKNMVNSIRYWLKAFDLVDEDEQPNTFARFVFGDNGKDPYLEDEGTLWLLHYRLVTAGHATIYSLFFNEFRKERIEFTKEHLLNFLKRKCDEWGLTVSLNSLNADIDVFLKTYVRPKKKIQHIEDDFSGILIDFDLLQEIDKSGDTLWYRVESQERETLPVEILLYALLDQESENMSISLRTSLNEENRVGLVYALNEGGLMNKIEKIQKKFSQIVFSDDAGIRELQRRKPLDAQTVLARYYEG